MPGVDAHLVAINNGVDSASQQNSAFTPFLNVINEWYAKDTSKKFVRYSDPRANPENRCVSTLHMAT